MKVHLVDGTYELFRQHFGQPSGERSEVGAARGVAMTVLAMLAGGATHVGVATDHVIESFRNDLWPGYKTADGMPEELLAQFGLAEEALVALGVTVWPMVELEADDALASAAAVAADDPAVEQVVICTPDKDLAQCVRGQRVVQLDRRHDVVTDEDGVWEKYGVAPGSIPDWLALVGDSADGFPGLAGWGKQSASRVLAHYRSLDAIPDSVTEWDESLRKVVRGAPRLAARLAEERARAELFRLLATLRVERDLLPDVEALRWTGPAAGIDEIGERLHAPGLAARARALSQQRR